MSKYNIDEYQVEGEETNYNFKISLVEKKINLQLSQISIDGYGKNYEGEFTLDELRGINKMFLLTKTIYEAQEEFKKAVEREKIALSENDEYVNIMFHMILGSDNAPFVIALPRNESERILKIEQEVDRIKLERDNIIEKINIISSNVDEITKNVSEIQNENKNLKQLISQTKSEMQITGIKKYEGNPIKISSSNVVNQQELGYNVSLENPLSKNNKLIMYGDFTHKFYLSDNKNDINNQTVNSERNRFDLKNKTIYNDNYFYSSLKNANSYSNKNISGIKNNIIKNEEEISFITRKLEKVFRNNIYYNLIYQGTVDGDTANIFHSKCDNISKTLVLIKDDKENIFGGFTSREWGGNCIQKVDDKAFIFSVNKRKIYDIIPKQIAIGCYPKFGPIFFGCQIRIFDHYFTKGGSTYLKGLNYMTTEDYELTNGNQKFNILDLEIYEILN